MGEGRGKILSTSFGLYINFDKHHDTHVGVPTSYRNKLCGLCGDFDGSADNEYTLPDGSMTTIVADFGNSWRWGGGKDCEPDPGTGDECDNTMKRKQKNSVKTSATRMVSSPLLLGPFKACHDFVNPDPFYDACVQDMCEDLDNDDLICQHFAEYASVCRAQGGDPETGGRKREYVSGDTYINDGCTESCDCMNGQLSCDPISCGDNEICSTRNDERGCYCMDGFELIDGSCQQAPGACIVWGDPHYVTFDDVSYNFKETVSTPSSRDCREESSTFHLISNNERKPPVGLRLLPERAPSRVQRYDYELINNGDIRIDGESVTLSILRWRGRHILERKRCGLSWRTASGTGHVDSVATMMGTKVMNSSLKMEDWPPLVKILETAGGLEVVNASQIQAHSTPVTQLSPTYSEAQDLCDYLQDPYGPFENCLDLVDPTPFYEACLYDLCETLPDDSLICDSLTSYAQECRGAGGIPEDWRDVVSQCPHNCPSGTVYDSCGPACPATCVDRDGPSDCPISNCKETCRCPEGQVLDGNQCVFTYQCGCLLDNGRYLSPGEEYTYPDCSRHCTCNNGNTNCVASTCDPDATCEIKNGVRDCYCNDGYTGDGQTCADAPGICYIWGDPHYQTFDGHNYDFQGGCDYTLVRDCLNETFHLVAKHKKEKHGKHSTELKELLFYYDGKEYKLKDSKKVYIDGHSVKLPYDGPEGVHIEKLHSRLTSIVADFGNSWTVGGGKDCEPDPGTGDECDKHDEKEAEKLCKDISYKNAYVCPDGLIYDGCATICPATCANPNAPNECNISSCVETCRCPIGQLLDIDTCVGALNCGCRLPNGQYVQSGETFIVDDCSQQCSCRSGALTCTSYGCHESELCTEQNDIRGCYCPAGYEWMHGQCLQAPSTCVIWGDPHYVTFDEVSYDFQGDCEYTLVRDCNDLSVTPSFHLVSNNYRINPSDSVSYLRELRLEYNGTEYELLSGGEVRVNGVTVTPPYYDGIVNIYYSGIDVVLLTDFGLYVTYNLVWDARIQLPRTYFNRTCGLCGNYDDNKGNELYSSSGIQQSAADFGNSWQTGTRECIPDPGPLDPCDPDSPTFEQSEALCYYLVDEYGPFEDCLDVVDPSPYYGGCIYDLCYTLPDDDLLCASLTAYAEACREAGVTLGDWRSDVSQCRE
ncbi:putative IgGFc-binding protein [Apostichopus japonicus]|uniref:Putative IgGFc-binding protein n=1 Tax=Stichopus japonicus TaxID=307972 RepID=A0A2G8JE87_STIJA|nr:putative IgGFc-binding protein [Apostichopus japonicus]